MNQQNEIHIADFQFQSIRKFMLPLYWELRHVEHLADHEKDKTINNTICEFFLRLRKFRYISVEEMSEALNVSVNEIEAFEAGNLTSIDLEHAYCDKCHGWFELEYLERRIRECRHPETRISKEKVAKDLLKRHGIIIPDVNFSRLNAPPADVIAMRSRSTT